MIFTVINVSVVIIILTMIFIVVIVIVIGCIIIVMIIRVIVVVIIYIGNRIFIAFTKYVIHFSLLFICLQSIEVAIPVTPTPILRKRKMFNAPFSFKELS